MKKQMEVEGNKIFNDVNQNKVNRGNTVLSIIFLPESLKNKIVCNFYKI